MPFKDPEKRRQYIAEHYRKNRETYIERSRLWHEEHREEAHARSATYRQEHHEEIVQYRRSYYSVEENRAAKRDTDKAYYQTNRAEIDAKNRAYIAARPELKRAINQRYDATHRAEILAKAKAKRAAHPEKDGAWSRAHPDARRAVARKYVKAHPERMRANTHRRLARKRALPVLWSAADEQAMLAYWHHACAACGNQDGFQWKISADHWIALADPASPGSVPWNMVPLCFGVGGCNNSKGARDPHVWLTARFGARKAKAILERIETYLRALWPHNDS